MDACSLLLRLVQQGATAVHAPTGTTGTAVSDLLRECSVSLGDAFEAVEGFNEP